MTAGASTQGERAISEESVVRATGRGWDDWFRELDAAGAKKLSHPEIVAIVSKQFGIGAWWRQMVTVEYERARGLRVRHQSPRGFAVTASKTVAAPVARVYSAWTTAATRRRWLADDEMTITTSTANRSVRFRWKGESVGAVGFVEKGENKTQVAVEHAKLASAAGAAKMKAYWKEQLAALQALVER